MKTMMSVMTMVMVAGLLPACSDGGVEARPDCSLVDCGSHGTCVDGSCQCEPGFQPTPDGLGCGPFMIDHCEDVTCSGLGHCSMEPLGPHGIDIPVCVCDPGAVPSEDLLDCVEPCAGVDCAPGQCVLDEDGQAACDCPPGYESLADPLACREQTTWAWELIYDPAGGAWVLGHAWMSIRQTADGHQVDASSSYEIPISYQGVLGGDVHTVARYDEGGTLVEVVQDHQQVFGTHTARRRLHAWADEGPEGPQLHFESRILDSIWHGVLSLDAGVPMPMAEAFEYPIFSYGCFDPFFYYALGQAVDAQGPAEQTLRALSPAFVIPFDLAVTVESEDGITRVDIPSYWSGADYVNGMLERVRYDWAEWLPTPAGAPLEMNLWPLPTTPAEHAPQMPPPLDEQEVSLTSADGTVLAGSLAPSGLAPASTAVLMVPGLLPGDRNRGLLYTTFQYDLAAWLADAGIASLRFDGRGVGASGGDPLCEPERLEEDIVAAHDWLLADPRFDRVVLLAHGFATPRAMRAAAALQPAGLVLMAPTGDDLVADLYHLTAAIILQADLGQQMLDEWFVPFAADLEALRTGASDEPHWDRSAAFWRDWLNRDLLDVTGLTEPVLILAGAEDLNLPAGNLDLHDTALTQAGNPPTVQIFEGLSHIFTPGSREQLWEEIHLPEPVAAEVGEAIATWLSAL